MTEGWVLQSVNECVSNCVNITRSDSAPVPVLPRTRFKLQCSTPSPFSNPLPSFSFRPSLPIQQTQKLISIHRDPFGEKDYMQWAILDIISIEGFGSRFWPNLRRYTYSSTTALSVLSVLECLYWALSTLETHVVTRLFLEPWLTPAAMSS